MKTGKTLQELAAEIERQAETAKDYIVSTEVLRMTPEKKLALEGTVVFDPLEVNDLTHGQIATHLGIPKNYYDKMLETQPELLARNVNTWFLARKPEQRMLRTLDGRARAFLSNAYRPINNYDLAEAVIPILMKMNVEIVSADITERKFYLKVVDKAIYKDIPVGAALGDSSHTFIDTVSPAMVISNSEVGCGALAVETAVWTRFCTNLMISAQRSIRKFHIGGKAELGEEMFRLLSDDTRKKTDIALWAQTQDIVKAAFDLAKFDALVGEIIETTTQKIEGDPVKVIELTSRRFGMTEGERTGVLRHLIEGANLTRYGLVQAVTRTAEDLDSYDRSTEFEKFGGELIALPKTDWKLLAEAA